MDFADEYGDLIIPLTTSEKGLAPRLCKLYNNAVGDTPTPSSEMIDIYWYIANGSGGKPIAPNKKPFAKELVKLEYIQYIQQWLNINAGSQPMFRTEMVNDFLGYKGKLVDWHNELRNMSRIKCGTPGPDLSTTYCTTLFDDRCGNCADRCMKLDNIEKCNTNPMSRFRPSGGCTSDESLISNYFQREYGEYQECQQCGDQVICGGDCPQFGVYSR